MDTLLTKVSGDSSLSSACTFIRNDAILSTDFTAAIQYLSNEVLARNRVVKIIPSRNISAASRREHPHNKSRNTRDNSNAMIDSPRKSTLFSMMGLIRTIFGGMSLTKKKENTASP